MPGPAVTIATHGFPVRAVDSGAPELTLKDSGGVPIVISDRGAPFVVDGYNPEPGDPVTIFEVAPAFTSNDNNVNSNFRVIGNINDIMGDEFRITIVPAAGGNPLTSAHVGLGRRDPNPTLASYPNMLEAPIEALFDGDEGFVSASTAQVSDWMPSGAMKGMVPGDQVVATYTTGGTGQAGQRYVTGTPNAGTFFQTNAAYWDVINTVGLGFSLSAGSNFALGLIETRWFGPEPVPGTTMPMSFNDPLFTDMRERTTAITLGLGQNLSKRSIVDTASSPASILCLGNNIIQKCRVMSNEAVRLTGGTVVMNQCYFEAEATDPEAHADTIQTYSPSDTGDFTLSNSYIKAYNTFATANWFTSDDWSGTIRFDNVVVDGGPFGIRVDVAEDCHIDLYLKDVYFVGPFGFDDFLLQHVDNGSSYIHQWDNVREATIDDGVLVPGDLIAAPLPTNLVTNSQAFNSWTATGATTTANVANDPVNGSAVADRMAETANLSQHSLTDGTISFTNAAYYTFSVWAKSEGGSSQFIQLLFGSAAFGSNAWCNFDLVNGTVETKGSAAVGKITSWGDGWFRCSMTAPATSTSSAPVVLFAANAADMTRAASYTGSTANTRLLFGAQVEVGQAANTYVAT